MNNYCCFLQFSSLSIDGTARSRDASPMRCTTESWTQTDDVIGDLVEVGELSEVKSRHDLLEIEREMASCSNNFDCYM